MKFAQYQHIERLGTDHVDGILDGTVYVFPKLDGTNVQVFTDDDVINCGSRTKLLGRIGNFSWRGLSEYIASRTQYAEFFKEYPNFRLHGEWLVPHTLKSYLPEAWNRLYVFDVSIDRESGLQYLSYDVYKPLLDKYDIIAMPAIAIVENGIPSVFKDMLAQNTYMMQAGVVGEGIVLKRYDFINKWGKTVWAKVINPNFSAVHSGHNPHPIGDGTTTVESSIVDTYVTSDLVEKEYARIVADKGEWDKKFIPMLLGVVYHTLIVEELWSALKKFKNHQTIDFKLLQSLTIAKVKELKKELFE